MRQIQWKETALFWKLFIKPTHIEILDEPKAYIEYFLDLNIEALIDEIRTKKLRCIGPPCIG